MARNPDVLHRHMPPMNNGDIPAEETPDDVIRILGDCTPATHACRSASHSLRVASRRALTLRASTPRHMDGRSRLAGGSPYTQKMLAVLRFYRTPHRYVTGAARQGLMRSGITAPRPQLAPTFYFQDEPMVDSTPIIARLEAAGVGGRSLVPPDEAMAFLSRLIEDFGDEWWYSAHSLLTRHSTHRHS
eukprot:COSAG06_NODE_507_length_14929_cov_109.047067_8_plen_188_part_00